MCETESEEWLRLVGGKKRGYGYVDWNPQCCGGSKIVDSYSKGNKFDARFQIYYFSSENPELLDI